ncbi:MAG: hypothetical protein KC620_04520, partial [Myxococcales bacterium]|nr:hypothetical protein [Myxococcales bacterium]
MAPRFDRYAGGPTAALLACALLGGCGVPPPATLDPLAATTADRIEQCAEVVAKTPDDHTAQACLRDGLI